MISAIFSSCITNRATVVTTATTAPIRTITTVADVNVSDNRISYTYIPSKADAKRLSKTQLLNNAIYMALKNNGNADVLLQINLYNKEKCGVCASDKQYYGVGISGEIY